MKRQRPKRPGTRPSTPSVEDEAGPSAAHVPVLVDAVVAALAPRDGAVYVDATFGGGGYSRALLSAARCRVLAIDRDPDAVAGGHDLEPGYEGRLLLVEGCFGEMVRLIGPLAAGPIAGIALDLGLSSIQLDTAARGFSFRVDGPLDMRMSRTGQDAADLVATLSESELSELIAAFGEERFARRVARAIVSARQRAPIRRTQELAAVVRGAVPKAAPGLDPATRTFQALRIAVNDELGELDRGLAAAEQLLMPGGRLAVVSFHSLEDRRVKDFLRARSAGAPLRSRHEPAPAAPRPPSFRLLHRRAIMPGAGEVAGNPRARSARLRAAERTAAAAWATNNQPPEISRHVGQVA
jgi:16S rRNA (cytosine1402-N4)-methyltransferase